MNIELHPNEEVKEIEGFSGLYSITSFGRVISHEKEWDNKRNFVIKKQLSFLRPFCISQKNRKVPAVCLTKDGKRRNFRIDFLVAKAFLKDRDNRRFLVCINGDLEDCRVENLSWCFSSNKKLFK